MGLTTVSEMQDCMEHDGLKKKQQERRGRRAVLSGGPLLQPCYLFGPSFFIPAVSVVSIVYEATEFRSITNPQSLTNIN